MSSDIISLHCEVEHEDTGQVGDVIGHFISQKQWRWKVEWRDKTYETPLGVPSEKLIRLRGPRQAVKA